MLDKVFSRKTETAQSVVVSTATTTYKDDNAYDVNYSNAGKSNYDLYDTNELLYKENNYAQRLTDHLVDRIIGEMAFRGSDADEKIIKKGMLERGLLKQIKEVVRQAIVLGNGMFFVDKKTKDYRRVNAKNYEITRTGKGIKSFTVSSIDSDMTILDAGKSLFANVGTKYSEKNIKHLTFLDYPDDVYGMSIYRSNIHDLESLQGINRDAYAALKQLSSVDRILSADLEGVRPANKQIYMDQLADNFKLYNSNTKTMIVLPKEHEIFYLGTKSGGTPQRVQPFRDIIETPLGLVMSSFAMSMGLLMPAGANKSILQEAEKASRYMIYSLRKTFTDWFSLIINDIFDTKGWVEVLCRDPPLDPEKDRENALAEVQAGVITLEEYREIFYPNLPKKVDEKKMLPNIVTASEPIMPASNKTVTGDNNHDGDDKAVNEDD